MLLTFVNDHNAVGMLLTADGAVPLMYKKGESIVVSKAKHHDNGTVSCLLPGGIEVNLPKATVKGSWLEVFSIVMSIFSFSNIRPKYCFFS